MLVCTCKISYLFVLFDKTFMKLFTDLYATYTVTVLTFQTVEFPFVENFQLLWANVLRYIAHAMTTMRARAFGTRVDFNDVMSLVETVLDTEFTIKCVFSCLFVLTAT